MSILGTGGLQPVQTQRESLSEIVYQAIRQAIITKELHPGSRISESALATQLNVSKTPVREALIRLEHMGLIESEGRLAGRVPTPSPESIKNAYEVREALESQTARLLATTHSPEDVDRIAELSGECLEHAESGDSDGFRRLDSEFHRVLAEATGNAHLAKLVRDAYDLTWALRLRDVPAGSASVTCAQQHQRITEAIRDGDAETADTRMREHIQTVCGLVLKSFPEA